MSQRSAIREEFKHNKSLARIGRAIVLQPRKMTSGVDGGSAAFSLSGACINYRVFVEAMRQEQLD